MPKRRQIKNPYVRYGPKAQGPYAQNLGGGAFGRAISRAEEECFYVTLMEIGAGANPDILTVCFNKNHQNCDAGFVFKLNGVAYTQIVPQGDSQPCITYQVSNGSGVPGTGPDDDVTASYTPGSCGPSPSEEDCLLEGFVDRAVENNVWGPIGARIGDLGDDILIVIFPSPPAVIGDLWKVDVNSVQRAVDYGSPDTKIEGNAIQLKLVSGVTDLDTVEVTHAPPIGDFTNAAQAADGRYCWRFYDYPVALTLGVDYWMMQSGERWLIEGAAGRWRLE